MSSTPLHNFYAAAFREGGPRGDRVVSRGGAQGWKPPLSEEADSRAAMAGTGNYLCKKGIKKTSRKKKRKEKKVET